MGSERSTHRMKRDARHQFEAWSGSYDRSLLNRFLFQPAYRVLMEEVAAWFAEQRRPFTLLDVGTGTGSFVFLAAAKVWPGRFIGLDLTTGMCEEASRKRDRISHRNPVSFVNGDSEHLPFADASIDLVTCANSFHHYPHQQAVVCEMRRILRPGGRLILIDGFRDNIIGWVVFDVIIPRIEGPVDHAPWTRIHDYFVRAGLSVIRRRKFSYWMPGLATVGEVPVSEGAPQVETTPASP